MTREKIFILKNTDIANVKFIDTYFKEHSIDFAGTETEVDPRGVYSVDTLVSQMIDPVTNQPYGPKWKETYTAISVNDFNCAVAVYTNLRTLSLQDGSIGLNPDSTSDNVLNALNKTPEGKIKLTEISSEDIIKCVRVPASGISEAILKPTSGYFAPLTDWFVTNYSIFDKITFGYFRYAVMVFAFFTRAFNEKHDFAKALEQAFEMTNTLNKRSKYLPDFYWQKPIDTVNKRFADYLKWYNHPYYNALMRPVMNDRPDIMIDSDDAQFTQYLTQYGEMSNKPYATTWQKPVLPPSTGTAGIAQEMDIGYGGICNTDQNIPVPFTDFVNGVKSILSDTINFKSFVDLTGFEEAQLQLCELYTVQSAQIITIDGIPRQVPFTHIILKAGGPLIISDGIYNNSIFTFNPNETDINVEKMVKYLAGHISVDRFYLNGASLIINAKNTCYNKIIAQIMILCMMEKGIDSAITNHYIDSDEYYNYLNTGDKKDFEDLYKVQMGFSDAPNFKIKIRKCYDLVIKDLFYMIPSSGNNSLLNTFKSEFMDLGDDDLIYRTLYGIYIDYIKFVLHSLKTPTALVYLDDNLVNGPQNYENDYTSYMMTYTFKGSQLPQLNKPLF